MSKINPLFFALGIPVLVIVVLLAIVVPRFAGGGKFTDLSPFSIDDYRKDFATLQGNAYRFECQIDKQLAFEEGKGRMLAVKPTDISRGTGRLPVFVPLSAGESFEVGQRFKFKVRVVGSGLVVEDLERF